MNTVRHVSEAEFELESKLAKLESDCSILRNLVIRQLNWQQHRQNVNIPMSHAEKSWIADAIEATEGCK